MNILNAKNIRKDFHHPTKLTVLSGINLSLKKGESIAIMGASGEGKTTLLNILGTLDSSTSGTLEIAGVKDSSNIIRNKHIGFIFQFFYLLEDYSVIDNVLMPAKIAKKSTCKGSEAYKRAEKLLERVQLTDRTNFSVNLLSGGEKQRVAIARALCNDPEIILADEPSGNLDHKTSKEIHNLLIECAREQKKSLIIATHDRELALLCDKRYNLQDGKLHLEAK